MKSNHRKASCFALLTIFWLLWGCTTQQDAAVSTELVVPGTGASEQILKRLAEAFNEQRPDLKVIIPKSTGTGGGIKAVSTGTHVLGRVGRPLKEDERNLGLTCLPFANDAVVFALGSDVDIQSLTSRQLEDIFTGKILDWQEVGGGIGPIRVMIRQPTESSLKIIGQHLPTFKSYTFTDQAKCAFHDFEMVELLKKYSTGIGFLTGSSLSTPGLGINAIALNGIKPSLKNIQSHRYPLMATYGLIFKNGGPDERAKKFIDFIASETGRKIILNHGLSPIARNS